MIDLNRAKTHLRILHNHEDDYIADLIAVAAQAVSDYLDRPLTDPICLTTAGSLKAPLQHAMLLIIGSMYLNRESEYSGGNVLACQNLMNPYRRLGV